MYNCKHRREDSNKGPFFKQGVFASLFPRDGEALYTLVNRGGNSTRDCPQLQLPKEMLQQGRGSSAGGAAGAKKIVYDCWRGEKLQPSADGVVSFDMDVEGYGACTVCTE